MTPSCAVVPATTSGVPPCLARCVDRIVFCSSARQLAASARDPSRPRRRRLCGYGVPSRSTPLMRVWAVNGMNSACSGVDVAPADAVFLLGQHDDGAALRRLVGQRCKLGASASSCSSRPARDELRGLAVAQRDRAGLVEQQRVHVAGRLDRACPTSPARCRCTRRSMPAMPIAESRPPMVVGIRQTSSAISTRRSTPATPVDRRTAAASRRPTGR